MTFSPDVLDETGFRVDVGGRGAIYAARHWSNTNHHIFDVMEPRAVWLTTNTRSSARLLIQGNIRASLAIMSASVMATDLERFSNLGLIDQNDQKLCSTEEEAN